VRELVSRQLEIPNEGPEADAEKEMVESHDR
jgi:hypothetical protein